MKIFLPIEGQLYKYGESVHVNSRSIVLLMKPNYQIRMRVNSSKRNIGINFNEQWRSGNIGMGTACQKV